MTTVYGLTTDGFVKKPLQAIRSDLNTALQSAFGASIDLGDKSIFGQITGIEAATYSSLWDLLEAVYSSQDPDKAGGASLEAVSAITGTFRPPAAPSTVTLTLFGTPGTVVPSGSVSKTASTGKGFTTLASATIAAVPNWIASHAYVVGNRVFSDTNRIYQCITAGTSHATIPVNGLGSDITDGTAHWSMIEDNLAAGSGAIDVAAQSVDNGPITAVAGDITVRVNIVSGWTAVKNLTDAVKGRNIATDEELRTLRYEELSGDGESPPDALRAALLRILNVLTVTIFTNNTDFINTDSMPPHSVEALVRTSWLAGDARDQQIYDTLFKNVAAGIVTTSSGTGAATGTAVDDQGVAHTIKFSRPVEVPIYAALTVTIDPLTFPADGVAQIQSAITAWGALQATGKDAVSSALSARAFQIPGVLDVTVCNISTAPSPTTPTTIPISLRQLATYDSSRITVTTANGTP